MSKMKRYFGTGLLIILPAFVTIYFLYIIFRFIDSIWGKVINYYFQREFGFSVPGLGFILGILTVFFVGFVATNFFGKRVFVAFEAWFSRFPFIRQIYGPAKQIVHSIVSHDRTTLKKVALIEYPTKGIWSVGFVTNEGWAEAEKIAGEQLMSILVATTPSPLTGFLVLMPKRNVHILSIPVEDGIKMIVSGGIVQPS